MVTFSNPLMMGGLALAGAGLEGRWGLQDAARGLAMGQASDRADRQENRLQQAFEEQQRRGRAFDAFLQGGVDPMAPGPGGGIGGMQVSNPGMLTAGGSTIPGTPMQNINPMNLLPPSMQTQTAQGGGGATGNPTVVPAAAGSTQGTLGATTASPASSNAGLAQQPGFMNVRDFIQRSGMAPILAAMGPQQGGRALLSMMIAERNRPRQQAQSPVGKLLADQARYQPGTPEYDALQQRIESVGGPNAKEAFKQANDLRDEFIKQSGDFVTSRDAFGRVLASAEDPSAAGDLALIFNFMKVLDPGSVVRESEFATAQNAAGIPAQVRNLYNRVRTGQRLSSEQRGDFVNRAQRLYNRQEGLHESLREQYTGLAERFRVDPQNVVLDLRGNFEVPDMTAPPSAKDEIAALAEGGETSASDYLADFEGVDFSTLDDAGRTQIMQQILEAFPDTENLSQAERDRLGQVLDRLGM